MTETITIINCTTKECIYNIHKTNKCSLPNIVIENAKCIDYDIPNIKK